MQNHSATEILSTLQNTKDASIVITTHHKPDADAMGSSLGLALFLKKLGFKTEVVSPTDFAGFLRWMKDSDKVMIFEHDSTRARELAKNADYIFCLDFNHLSRINEFGVSVGESPAKKILIDHHQYPQNFQDYTYWDDKASSSCELVYRFIEENQALHLIDSDIAACLYTGIVTDTGSFRFSSCSSETMRIAASLMDKGINHASIFDLVYDSFTESRVKFIGYAIYRKMEVLKEFNTALITINQDELKEFQVITGDTEGLVNYGLSIEGVKFATLIIDRGKIIKMSFRSKGNFASNNFAMKHFNGGGHFHAAGGSSYGTLQEAVADFKNALKLYQSELHD